MTTQLERDLLNNTRERLILWVKDTKWRCEAMGLDEPKTLSMIFSAILDVLCSLSVDLGISREQLCIIVQNIYDIEVKNKSRNVEKRG